MHRKEPAPRKARHQVFQELRARIVSLNLPPGTPISENDLAARLGVSRTPIREAILLLAEEGLVEVFPRVGTFVTRLDLKTVRESQFLREAVELASLRSITYPLDPEVVAEIQENLRQQEAVPDDDLGAFFVLDEAFHRSLMALADHAGSWAVVAGTKSHLDRARVMGIQAVADHRRFYEQHRDVFDAVLAQDLHTAEQLLTTHLRVIFTDIQEAEAQVPDLFAKRENDPPGLRPSYNFAEWLRYDRHANQLGTQSSRKESHERD